MSATRPRDEDQADDERSPKRTKVTEDVPPVEASASSVVEETTTVEEKKQPESLLPPSHALLNAPSPVYTPDGSMQRIMETDVGISEYVGHDVPKIEGIIKQR